MTPSTLDQYSGEIMQLVQLPELATIERRARQRRKKRALRVAAGVISVPLVAAGLVVATLPRGPANHVAAPPTSVTSGPVQWADAADADHLYAIVASCNTCPDRLVGSDDGGRTWTSRPAVLSSYDSRPRVRGPQTIMVPAVPAGPSLYRHPARISTDGGRTWADLTTSAAPVTRVPAGGWLQSSCDTGIGSLQFVGSTTCTFQVVDPARRRISPLANPPGGTPNGVAPLPVGVGLWVPGLDRDGKPTLSVSQDGGATWSTHVFDVAQVFVSGYPESVHVQVSTHDGRTVDVLVNQYGFRSTDGGSTWYRSNGGAPVPGHLFLFDPAVTLPDGTHVLQQLSGDVIRPLVSRDGTAYVPGAGNWPPTAARIAGDGAYVANDRQKVYRSTDGKTWTATAVPGERK